MYSTIYFRSPQISLEDHNIRYPAPIRLQGSGSVVLDTLRNIYTAIFPVPTFPFHNHDYSIGMWLCLLPDFDIVMLNMRFNDFLLEFTLSHTKVQVSCSHDGGFQAQADIKIPPQCWFYIVLTYSSTFRFYVNDHAYSLDCSKKPLSANEMFWYSMVTDNDGYLILHYQNYPKFSSMARFADIRIVRCALTLNEIRAIIEQTTCIEQVNMGRYLPDHWTNIHWYFTYFFGCILL